MSVRGDGDGEFSSPRGRGWGAIPPRGNPRCHPYTQQRVYQRGPLSASLPSALGGTRQSFLICRVSGATTLGKEALSVHMCSFSAECYGPDTRQSTSLPSVTLGKVTSIHLFNLFLLFHPKNKRYHIYNTYIT
jgi:hypothetical protein